MGGGLASHCLVRTQSQNRRVDEAYWLHPGIQTLRPHFFTATSSHTRGRARSKGLIHRGIVSRGPFFGGETGATHSHYSLTAAVCTFAHRKHKLF